MKPRAWLLVVPFALAGCASTKVYAPLEPADDRRAVVHVLRDFVQPRGYLLHVYVDGQLAASVANESSASFSVPVGERVVRLEWEEGGLFEMSTLETRLALAGREVRYFQVTAQDAEQPSALLVPPVIGAFVYMKRLSAMPLQFTELTPGDGQQLLARLKRP